MSSRREPSKEERSRLRELASIAYERELSRELAQVEDVFRRWRGGEINAFGVSEAIHQFHQGPSQDLFSKYRSSNLEIVVAQAIHNGFISKDEVGPAVLECLAEQLAFFGRR
jgi:hypothetical protein